MKFTILGHACMLVEHEGRSLLMDPWLFGSCYWRSWWHYPEPPAQLIESIAPDYIYITHLHWDHFHGPTLRKLKRRNPNVKVIIPKLFSEKMLTDLRYCDIDSVIELAHGDSISLGPDFLLYSYQFDIATDSCAVLTDGTTTLLNVNDCKIFGAPLRQVLSKHPRIDFAFRSHTSATAIPYCIEGYETDFTEIRSKLNYIKDFCNFALHVGARYAVPFASNHCFLHQDTVRFNRMIVSPLDVQAHFDTAVHDPRGTACVVMPPGSSWSRREGFHLIDFDYKDQDNYIAKLRARYQDVLSAQYDAEQRTRFDQAAFEAYFTQLFRNVPKIVRRKLPPVVFGIQEASSLIYLQVNFEDGRVSEALSDAPQGSLVVKMAASVLNACVTKRMFNVLAPSKRLSIRLPVNDKAWLQRASSVLSLLSWHDQGYFPIWNNLSARSMAVRHRRWRDIYEYARVFAKYRLLKHPLVTSDLWPARQR
jgi:UDP-MurNAc hydroxylase